MNVPDGIVSIWDDNTFRGAKVAQNGERHKKLSLLGFKNSK
jgi:hypothetical protein